MVDDWFNKAIELSNEERAAKALDLTYDTIDKWLRGQEFAKCDQFLREVVLMENVPSRLLYALAILTCPVQDYLPFRSEFYKYAWKTMRSQGKDVEKLLGRLR